MNSSGWSGAGAPATWLLCRVDDRTVAVPLDRVIETMRPLALRSLPGLPRFVPGVAVIRDGVVPVVRVGSLLGGSSAAPGRFVTVVAGAGRTLALAVDDVIGIRTFEDDALGSMPPLAGALEGGALAAIGTLDSGLLLVLEASRLLTDDVWAAIADPGRLAGVT